MLLADAEKAVAGARAKATEIGVAMAIAVVNEAGCLIDFIRMDDSELVAVPIAQDKAYTALVNRLSTMELGVQCQPGWPAVRHPEQLGRENGHFPRRRACLERWQTDRRGRLRAAGPWSRTICVRQPELRRFAMKVYLKSIGDLHEYIGRELQEIDLPDGASVRATVGTHRRAVGQELAAIHLGCGQAAIPRCSFLRGRQAGRPGHGHAIEGRPGGFAHEGAVRWLNGCIRILG